MKSQATTASAYLDTLAPDRRNALASVRKVIVANLDDDFEECMQYGVVAYVVPHRVWPHGHHTNPKLPLMYMGLSSQKNDMVVYMLFLLHNERERDWFVAAWKATGKKSSLEVTGAGCCLRFKKVEDLSLEVIAEAMRRMPVKKYLEDHTAMLSRLGKGPDGKQSKQGDGARKATGSSKAKSAIPRPKSKTSKK